MRMTGRSWIAIAIAVVAVALVLALLNWSYYSTQSPDNCYLTRAEVRQGLACQ